MTRQEEFVARFREQTPDIDDEIDIFLAWLKENGPDEWHRWAINWNWDHGTEIFEWIVAQPNCDKGTALSIYYAGQPDYFTRYASLEEAEAATADDVDDIVGMIKTICRMWREGAYPTYAYHPSEAAIEYLAQGEEAMVTLAAAAPWDVPPGMA